MENRIVPPAQQSIFRGTQVASHLHLDSVGQYFEKTLTSLVTHNFLWDVDEPDCRKVFIHQRRATKLSGIAGVSIMSAACCAAGGLFMSQNCAHVAAETIVGSIVGCQVGYLAEKKAHAEALRIDASNSTGEILIDTSYLLEESSFRRLPPGDNLPAAVESETCHRRSSVKI